LHGVTAPAPGEGPVAPDPRVRIAPLPNRITMDVEHINAIGNHLADLSKRTVDLRGYL
jgi:hypothetical protein